MNGWFTLPQLPLTDPIPIFLLVLLIILSAPLLNKIKIPHIIGLILAGILLGPFGLNVLANDKSFELFGKVGILYIMFLAGLEIDLNTFKKNRSKGFTFSLFTFVIPLILGTLSGFYILKFDWITSTLLASIFASHTLIAYPIVSKMGISKHRSISIAVAGTIFSDTGALLMLAAIVAIQNNNIDALYWVKFGVAVLLCGLIIFIVLPKISRYFLRRFSDSVAQYIFVLAVVFLASLLTDAAGLEGILGAFFAGLVLNRLIPNISPLMNRIEFVGNAIFIPFFLISIGMLIDLQAFFASPQALLVATVMTVIATASKWLAAVLTQKSCKLTQTEGQLIFGLSNGKAATALAVVMIGHKIGLLNDDVLNGTVVMILVSCTISSIVTEKAARKIASAELKAEKSHQQLGDERILIPISNPATMPHLIEFGNLIKPSNNKKALFALNIESQNDENVASSKLMDSADNLAAATDNKLTRIVKNDINIANCIVETIEEENITDVLVGIHKKNKFVDTFFGNTIERLLKEAGQTIFICNQKKPTNSVKRLIVVVPAKAELETGFAVWFNRVKNIATNLSIKLVLYGNKDTNIALKKLCGTYNDLVVSFRELASWEDFLIITKAVKPNDSVIIISARKGTLSYNPLFEKLPYYLTKYFTENNFAIVFPKQIQSGEKTGELFNPLHL
ncbi:MAG: cation:proton antiporter [Prevotellaceae bacterium]|nr:cation:proton antiporter [Prevotellaceae bacterium]